MAISMTGNTGRAEATGNRSASALSIWATGTISLSATAAAPAVEAPALLFVESGSVTARQGAITRSGGKHSLIVFTRPGRITLSTTAEAVVHCANVLTGGAAGFRDDAYVCELEVFAKASSMLGDFVEVTTVLGIEVAVNASATPGTGEWRVWRQFDCGDRPAGGRCQILIRRVESDPGRVRRGVLDLAIIGAGPTGASLYAHARAQGLEVEMLGEPLAFWKRHILPLPLRSPAGSTNIDCPQGGNGFLDFARERNLDVRSTIDFPMFIAYFCWFMKRHGVQPRREEVVDVRKTGAVWHVVTERGVIRARNVAIAVGLNGMQRIPPEYRGRESAFTHVSSIKDFTELNGRSVAVLGGGQSAVEAAVAMSQSGVETHLVVRGEGVVFRSIHSPGNLVYKLLFRHVERFMRRLPGAVQDRLIRFLLRGTVEPTIEDALRRSSVKVHERSKVVLAPPGGPWPASIDGPGGRSVTVDHVVLGTGYQFDIRKLRFLRNVPIHHRNGLPYLNDNAECSQSGMYFCGIAALRLIGPQCQFVFGSRKLSPRIVSGILARRKCDDQRIRS